MFETMASLPTIKVVFDRRKTASLTKKASVEIEVYYNRQRTRISTGVSVLKQQWKNGVVVSHPEAKALNETIRNIYDAISSRVDLMVKNGKFDMETLKKTKETEVEKSAEFLDWLEDRIYKRSVKESTRRQHLVMLQELRRFGLIRSFSDLTTRNIKLWDDALKAKLNCQSSVHGYHKRLKPYILEAIQLELLAANPYDGIKIPRGKSEGIKYLTEDERNRIEALELYGPVEKARDMFIFACYTGLAYSDLIKVSKKDFFMEGEDMCIVDKRQKTGAAYTIVLLPKAVEILKKYNFNINLMTNQKCNENLKLIAQMAHIHLNLTMHVGRHTFATWALTKGVGIETVSKMLAHSDISMTEKYAKVLNSSVISGFHKLRI